VKEREEEGRKGGKWFLASSSLLCKLQDSLKVWVVLSSVLKNKDARFFEWSWYSGVHSLRFIRVITPKVKPHSGREICFHLHRSLIKNRDHQDVGAKKVLTVDNRADLRILRVVKEEVSGQRVSFGLALLHQLLPVWCE
jgi:hypothetical protein